MAILGIGTDVCMIGSIRRSLSRFGGAFTEHLFSLEEQRFCNATRDPAIFYARAFSGKEACAKALGTGFTEEIGWRDIVVIQSDDCTLLRLSCSAERQLALLTPPGHTAAVHISCTSDGLLAFASVMISSSHLRETNDGT